MRDVLSFEDAAGKVSIEWMVDSQTALDDLPNRLEFYVSLVDLKACWFCFFVIV